MKTINNTTRNMHKYFELNAGVCVAYWGSVRTWKEGCRMYAEKVMEGLFMNDDAQTLKYLIGRMKWLWDREHFLDAEESKTLEAFYSATTREVAQRMLEMSNGLKLDE